ncbi:hypothetical protein MTO96_034145, partial [Rhipicephalus appendiculatus]
MKNRAVIAHMLLVGALVVRCLPAVADVCHETWEFDCGNGKCVAPWELCDGYDHCGNNADEGTSTGDFIVCPPCCFACQNLRQCINPSGVCDGDNDCKDGSDEKNCPGARVTALNCSLATRREPTVATPSSHIAPPDATSPT